MKLKLIKALWGMNGSLESQFERIAAAGYDGVEAPLPAAEDEQRFRDLLRSYGFDYIAMVFTAGDEHLDSFERQVNRAADFRPLSITSHSVSDSMPVEEQVAFFRKAAEIERGLGIPVGHETHRGRALFNPWDTSRVLREVPGMKLTADFSHWCCVCESTLDNQEAHLEAAFPRVLHIHGRVGYAEGPQVPDPRAPEYSRELSRHLGWWDRIVEEKRKAGAEFVTFTPEFGPPGYLHTLPFTNQPVADLWDVCLWMAQTFKARFEGK
ncbi:sugar phosphate isomerase/epimerase family protein [Paenibacillus humicola]|uniref:sugar phosphate isomerase/epimerase family protein n=1 Tax=Paenibacillus humicola TaxID=3110540 RepID=UPI00237AD0DC|nr:TIM barrel protein [Paenibacillus humicola]